MSIECLVKIKDGAKISQDMGYGIWPACKPPCEEWKGEEYHQYTKQPDAIFLAEKKKDYWDCKRFGYGLMTSNPYVMDAYGNGSVYVRDMEGVEILTPMHIKGVLKLLER